MSTPEADERPSIGVGADEPTPTADPDGGRVADFEPPSIAAGGLSALLFRIVELCSLILLVVVTGRLMEPAGRGLYALASLMTALLVLPLGAVWVSNVVEMTQRRATLRELFGGSLVIATVGGLATGAVALAVAPLLGDRWWVVAIPAVATPFLLLQKYEEGLYQGLGHVQAVNLIRVANAVLPLVFIAPALLAGASSRTAIAIWILSFIALPLLILAPLRSLVGGPKLPRDRGLYRRVVTYGIKISGLNAMDTVNSRVGLLALAAFATDAAVGVYSIALAAELVLVMAPQALALSAFRRIGVTPPEPSASLTVRAMRHSILLTSAGALILLPIVFVGVPWAVGAGYEDVPLLFLLLIPHALCWAALTSLYTFFQVQAKQPGVLLKVSGCTLVANVALTLALAPAWDTWGVAVAASLAGVVGAAVAFHAFHAESGTRLREVSPGRAEVADYVALLASRTARWRRSDVD